MPKDIMVKNPIAPNQCVLLFLVFKIKNDKPNNINRQPELYSAIFRLKGNQKPISMPIIRHNVSLIILKLSSLI
jgi:hypothetical protein